jgi:transposase
MRKLEINLTKAEQEWLYRYTQSGSQNHQAFKRAQILLAINEYAHEMKDAEIAQIVGVSPATIYNTRKRYLEQGVERAVERKVRKDKGTPVKVDGRAEAMIIALACSKTPNLEPKWTLKMLADEVIDLALVESISLEKIRQVLKKHAQTPSQAPVEHPT